MTCSQTTMASTASAVATTTSALASLANEEGEELRTPFLSLAASRLSKELVGAHITPGMMCMCVP